MRISDTTTLGNAHASIGATERKSGTLAHIAVPHTNARFTLRE